MDFGRIDRRVGTEVEPTGPIPLTLRKLSGPQAKAAVDPWINSRAFPAEKRTQMFARTSRQSWTVTIMSSLKEKVHEIRPGTLRWILSTALPLRPDFAIWLDGKPVKPSKTAKGRTKRWILGREIVALPKPGPKKTATSTGDEHAAELFERYGLDVPNLGRVTGYAEAYKDLLTGGKSEEWGRSHGFFVYVRGRLLNVDDGHFGISPDELRHGSFGRFRLVIHIDRLDHELRSNREAVGDGPLLQTARDLLRSVFNFARPMIEAQERSVQPGAMLARNLASSPASLAHRPIVDLVRSALDGSRRTRHLSVPLGLPAHQQRDFVEAVEARGDDREHYVTDVAVRFESTSQDAYASFRPDKGELRLNGYHPFVATFYDEFNNPKRRQPLELIAMAEVLAEAHLHSIGVNAGQIQDFLSARDQLLRYLTDASGRQSALSIANKLQDARNNPDALEDAVCTSFSSLGFDVTPLGKKGRPRRRGDRVSCRGGARQGAGLQGQCGSQEQTEGSRESQREGGWDRGRGPSPQCIRVRPRYRGRAGVPDIQRREVGAGREHRERPHGIEGRGRTEDHHAHQCGRPSTARAHPSAKADRAAQDTRVAAHVQPAGGRARSGSSTARTMRWRRRRTVRSSKR